MKVYVEDNLTYYFIKALCEKISLSLTSIDVMGNDSYEKLLPQFQKNTDEGLLSVIILDSDNDTHKDKKGFINKKSAIEDFIKDNNLKMKYFLMPNHGDDGAIEDLLLSIINPEYAEVLNCFDNYVTCLEKSEKKYQSPIIKSKYFAYLDAFPKSNKEEERMKKGDVFRESLKYWNMESKNLDPMKEFLLQCPEALL